MLEQVTEAILNQMQASGWYGEGRERRFDRPTPRDINNGNCEEWAELAVATVGGEAVWLDTFKTTATWRHCVLYLNGCYYDSLHLNGCHTLKQFISEARAAAREAYKLGKDEQQCES